MKLILQESITGLGNPGDLVQVKSGYGRNYLLPSGKAIIANEENMKVYEAKQEELKLQEEKRLESAKEIFEKINEFSVSQNVAISEEGTMYGSVGTKEISELLEANDFQIERSAVRLPEGSLKELGNYVIDIELHPEVIAKINLELKPEES
ncbi:50S ribosomal protein L9 [Gammaproteobacteria bacterium]|jgi:large subunit ribosomal protein L9|nr:50S ribosomal protein L9 [Gammaproteobacteria bacterium]MDC3026981.1 50S ribosomal protein L9 [Gammaproteobacteria bacterium]MDC3066954.1 50S ribosomal protein L9 [Gammaproteobacteria bacterium]GIS22313.1 MAG: 50S ribosomal protein L9 [Gammaproteobacteria bacterium]|tara:strand:- start:24 stop:476 length:453 start_codon:yes stop_codon:yes gene_type:complete